MWDVEDPYPMAASPILAWQDTEHGTWVMERVLEKPVFYCHADHDSYGFQVVITGILSDQDEILYHLKWGFKT